MMRVASRTGLVQAVQERLLARIGSGELEPGDRVEPVTQISADMGVGHVTAARAVKALAEQGYLHTIPGKGTFVSSDARELLNGQISGHGVSGKAVPGNHVAGMANMTGNTVVGQRTIVPFIFFNERDIAPEGFSLRAYLGIQEQARMHGLEPCLFASALDEQARPLRFNEPKKIRGIIISSHGERHAHLLRKQIRLKVPVVYCSTSRASNLFAGVFPDNFLAGLSAGRYLLERGHERIAYVGPFVSNSPFSFDERCFGLQRALGEHGLEPADRFKWHIQKHTSDISNLIHAIRRSRKSAPTALVVATIGMGVEIAHALQQADIAVPDKLSIVTFEDRLARESEALTTVRYCMELMGRQAMDLLLRVGREKDAKPVNVMVPVEVVERGSVAKC